MVKEEGLGVKGGGLGWENVGKSGRVGGKKQERLRVGEKWEGLRVGKG